MNNNKTEPTSHSSDSIDIKIFGSPKQAFIVDTSIAFLGTGPAVVFNAPVTAMKNLNPILQGLLVPSPLLATVLNQIPMTRAIKKNGGKKALIVAQSIALAGMLALTALAATTDITTINSFDYRFAITLLSGYAVGMGSGAFPLITDTMKWTTKEKYLPIVQSAFGAIVDSSNTITPVVIHLLRQYGFTIPFGLYSGTLFIGILIAAKYLHPSPFDQLKNKLAVDLAKKKAMEYGQLPEMIEIENPQTLQQLVKKHVRLFLDPRSQVLNFALFTTLGSFFVTGTIFPSLLKHGFNVDESEAIYSSSIANLISIAARLVSGKLISKWDTKTGGVNVHLLACGISVVAAIPLVAFDLPRWALYSSVALLNTGLGMGVVTPLNLALPWSNAENKDLDECDLSTMFGLLSSVGTVGGIVLPLMLGLMVNGLGDAGYQYYFLLLIAMMAFSGITVSATHHHVNQPNGSFFGNTVNFFQSATKSKTPKYSFSPGDDDKLDQNHVMSTL